MNPHKNKILLNALILATSFTSYTFAATQTAAKGAAPANQKQKTPTTPKTKEVASASNIIDTTKALESITTFAEKIKAEIKKQKASEDKRYDDEVAAEQAELKKAGVKPDHAAMKQFSTYGPAVDKALNDLLKKVITDIDEEVALRKKALDAAVKKLENIFAKPVIGTFKNTPLIPEVDSIVNAAIKRITLLMKANSINKAGELDLSTVDAISEKMSVLSSAKSTTRAKLDSCPGLAKDAYTKLQNLFTDHNGVADARRSFKSKSLLKIENAITENYKSLKAVAEVKGKLGIGSIKPVTLAEMQKGFNNAMANKIRKPVSDLIDMLFNDLVKQINEVIATINNIPKTTKLALPPILTPFNEYVTKLQKKFYADAKKHIDTDIATIKNNTKKALAEIQKVAAEKAKKIAAEKARQEEIARHKKEAEEAEAHAKKLAEERSRKAVNEDFPDNETDHQDGASDSESEEEPQPLEHEEPYQEDQEEVLVEE